MLSISALIKKASAPTPRWIPFWLKLLMVTTMRQSSEDVDTGALPRHATKYFGGYVIGEDIMF